MVDLPSTVAASPALAVTGTQNLNLTPIQVAVTDLSQSLQDFTRAIQTNAIPTSVSNNSLTLTTALGNISVALPQQLNVAEQQNLLQQLMGLIQSQRPITLTLQPATSPPQATLLLPTSTPNLGQTSPILATEPPVTTASVLAAPLAIGNSLPAIVLPNITPQPLPLVAQPIPSLIPTPQVQGSSGSQVETVSGASGQVGVFQQLVPAGSLVAPSVSQALINSPVLPLAPTQLVEPLQQPSAAKALLPNAVLPGSQTVTAEEFSAPVALPEMPTAVIPAPNSLVQNSQPAQQPSLANLLQPGNEITLRVDSIASEASGNPLSSPSLAPNQISATVIGTGSNNQLILKSNDITLLVRAPALAPIGTNVIVSIDIAKQQDLFTLPTEAAPVNFPSLPQALAALTQIDPQALQQILANHIPQPTEALPGALMLLFGAFKQSNVREWLGSQGIDSLINAGKSDLVSKLSQELNDVGQPVQDSVVGEWHTYPIPLYSQQQFQALTLYVHSDGDKRQGKDKSGSGGKKVRFLIDMRLTKLGSLQLDGFVQPQKIDMILRSEVLLPQGLHNELRTAYIKAMSAIGHTGILNFQIGRQHWMRMEQPAQTGLMT